jgi:hypothetical protein
LPAQDSASPPDTQQDIPTTPRRIHLILRDGTFQLVLSYTVVGDLVHYRSAERNGALEEIPLALVDLPATEAWIAARRPKSQSAAQERPVLSPELAKEEADRAARTPEVAPDLRLPDEESVLVLDTFTDTPELVPLAQNGGDLNKETAHNVLALDINPASAPHRILEIRGDRSDVQLHVPQPEFFIRLGTKDTAQPSAIAFTVDTHGASARETPSGGSESSSYIIERLDVRVGSRILDSFRISSLGLKPQPDIIETSQDPLPRGHWMKLTPNQPLEFGEYALIEVLNSHEVNLAVWDFGIHSAAPDNVEAIHPTPKQPVTLERRKPDDSLQK